LDYLQTIADLKKREASDLHLEPGLAPSARIQGELKPLGSEPVRPEETLRIAQDLLSETEWAEFQERRSSDLSLILANVRCRVHIMKTHRGVGLAIRLLSSFQPSLERLNLHPDLAGLVKLPNGLIVVTGPTGSGKSSTLAALLYEISTKQSLHIVTIESPIEYPILPRRSFIRQREVGLDTPSFDRALLDALRQDPDVIMVGEMRERETIRLTLNAAETGQLVLTTLHAANAAEAVHRIVAAFPPEIQGAVRNQLAGCLIAVVAQRLRFKSDFGIRVPVCEILRTAHATRNMIRQGQFFKLESAIETGRAEGCWTFRRYQQWLDGRTEFYVPKNSETIDPDLKGERNSVKPGPLAEETDPSTAPEPVLSGRNIPSDESAPSNVIVIDEPEEESVDDLLKKLGSQSPPKKPPSSRKKGE